MRPSIRLFIIVPSGRVPVLDLCIPRGVAYALVVAVAALAATGFHLAAEYVALKREAGEVAALRRGAGERGELGRSLGMELASIRSEISAWTALHARMREALGRGGISNAATSDVPVAVAGTFWDELDLVAATVADEGPRVRELEQMIGQTGKLVAKLPLRWPVRGSVNSEYGRRRSPWTGRPAQHEGIDIGSPSGTPIESPAAGKVITATLGGAFGKYVVLEHGNGIRSRYGHLKEFDVRAGDRVERGQVIGLVGQTGRSTGPHLHYEVLVQGKPVNPREFLLE